MNSVTLKSDAAEAVGPFGGVDKNVMANDDLNEKPTLNESCVSVDDFETSQDVTEGSLYITEASLDVTEASLDVTEASLDVTEASLDVTEVSLDFSSGDFLLERVEVEPSKDRSRQN